MSGHWRCHRFVKRGKCVQLWWCHDAAGLWLAAVWACGILPSLLWLENIDSWNSRDRRTAPTRHPRNQDTTLSSLWHQNDIINMKWSWHRSNNNILIANQYTELRSAWWWHRHDPGSSWSIPPVQTGSSWRFWLQWLQNLRSQLPRPDQLRSLVRTWWPRCLHLCHSFRDQPRGQNIAVTK